VRKALLLAAACLALGAGGEAPLRLTDLDGRPVELGPPAAGEKIVVHFWATWCPSCKEELAVLEEAAKACAGQPVQVVAVDVDEDAGTVRRFLGDRALGIPLLLDPTGHAWRRTAGRMLPVNLTWSAEDRAVSFGTRDARDWVKSLAALGCR
jgi:thiol-disulfide isomerase/thioredoxin